MRPRDAWQLTRCSVSAFFEDDAFSKGAAISFYAVLALGPILLIIVALAGFLYGDDAARGALLDRLNNIMGAHAAGFLQDAIKSAGSHGDGVTATIVGVVSLLLTATGVFGELQTALNAIWRVPPKGSTMRQLLRSRLVSLGLVLLLALVLIVSLVLSALIVGLQHQLNRIAAVPAAAIGWLNFVLSFALLSALITAVYKVLPDRDLDWRDVAAGAVVTALLITIGKVAIGIYIGSSATISGYGAAGSVIAVLFWIYYSVEIFLLGAEFTRVYAEREDLLRRSPAASAQPNDRESAGSDRLSRTPG
ncbi:MAG TPA: YihY/virulence factor BrkB family protein [Acetobacteraceae bacterium]|jgi:membrane protein|nr:YihY/virulence factor BrkB family protein [Acetobacteraceae bacterium]